MYQHPEEQEPLPGAAQELLRRSQLEYPHKKFELSAVQGEERDENMVRLAVKRCSLSRLGMVDGAKCSFRRIVCLMMFRRSRIASIRDSAVPNTDDG